MFTFEHKLKYRRVQRDQSLKQRDRLSKHATIENDCTSLIMRYNLSLSFYIILPGLQCAKHIIIQHD
jgi:hypothetical protein